jgi:NAD+ synthase
MNYNFNRKETCESLKRFMITWYEANAKGCKLVIGISGGKDSSIMAALCCAAIGKENVLGVLIPNGVQSDIDVSQDLCKTLGIQNVTVNIRCAYDAILAGIDDAGISITEQTKWNLPPRLRMSVLYAVAQSCNGRVVNTSNYSEDWVGWMTRWGDSVGDVMPFALLTASEVKEIGYELGLDKRFIEKAPADGLVGATDEEKFGFTYATLDKYIRTGECASQIDLENITNRHNKNLFKLMPVPMFQPAPGLLYDMDNTVFETEDTPTLCDGRYLFSVNDSLVPELAPSYNIG